MKHTNKVPRMKGGKSSDFKSVQRPFELGRRGPDWSGARQRPGPASKLIKGEKKK